MEVSYKINFWDYFHFNWYTIFHAKISLILVTPVVFSVGWLALDVARRVDISLLGKVLAFLIVLFFGLGTFLLVMIVLSLITMPISYLMRKAKWNAKKILATEDSLLVETWMAKEEIKWPAIEAIKRSQRLILIYVSKSTAVVVPKRSFARELDADKFFVYISELWERYKYKSDREKVPA